MNGESIILLTYVDVF